MATVKILYFAWVREKIGCAEETRVLPSDLETVADLVGWLRTQGPEYAAAFENTTSVRAALDQNHATQATSLAGVREVAFFPPVTGG